jgi:NADPH:quinone reductase-like Zn-dependent oxidoreductase
MAFQRYGGPEVIEEMELPRPKVGPDTVLVRTRAAGLNPVDWKLREGHLEPRHDVYFPCVPGWDVAGVVAAVGFSIVEFAQGDEVLGYVRRDEVRHGTYAELVPAPVRAVVRKPAALSWPVAAGLSLSGLTAYQALRAVGVGAGDTVLVHAAAGGVGHLAVQLAQIFGAARVIGTASKSNHDYLQSLGAEPVEYGDGLADRVRALAPDGVDAALDLIGGDAVDVSRELVATRARIASITNPAGARLAGGRYVFVRPDPAGLAELAGYVESGRLTVHIAQTYPLGEAAAAQQLVQEGHVRGKVVLEV